MWLNSNFNQMKLKKKDEESKIIAAKSASITFHLPQA